jgi:hypothetical protein
MRDLEHLILYTLCMNISEVSGIPTGRIMAKMPDIQFVNKYDGSNNPEQNAQKFPCVGMKYCGDVKYDVNLYGSGHRVLISPNQVRIYKPLGEIWAPLTIYLFTNSRKEQREIGTKIAFYLASNTLVGLRGDDIPGEYMSIVYESFRDLNELRPYARAFDIKVNARMLQQIPGYLVNQINTNMVTTINGDSATASEPETLTNTITGESYVNEDVDIRYSLSEEGNFIITEDGTIIAFDI